MRKNENTADAETSDRGNGVRASSPVDDDQLFIGANSQNQAFYPEKCVDDLMRIVIALGAEHWTMRRRMCVLERLLESKCDIHEEDIEKYKPSDEEQKSWRHERDLFIRRVFNSLASQRTDESKPHQGETDDH